MWLCGEHLALYNLWLPRLSPLQLWKATVLRGSWGEGLLNDNWQRSDLGEQCRLKVVIWEMCLLIALDASFSRAVLIAGVGFGQDSLIQMTAGTSLLLFDLRLLLWVSYWSHSMCLRKFLALLAFHSSTGLLHSASITGFMKEGKETLAISRWWLHYWIWCVLLLGKDCCRKSSVFNNKAFVGHLIECVPWKWSSLKASRLQGRLSFFDESNIGA